MKILHLTQKDFRVSQWSGGTTTELLIWPQGADYARREFQVRISSATVDLPESDFTPLPGVLRYITPLSGGFTLTHPGAEAVHMDPLDPPYRFPGDIATHCVGKATDLNLMLKGTDGEMTICREFAPIRPGLNGFYATDDGVFRLGETGYPMESGQLLVVFSQETAELEIGSGSAVVFWAQV